MIATSYADAGGSGSRVHSADTWCAGMKLIQRHRRINEALKDEIAQIHALQIAKCHTPEQASKQQ